MNFTDFSVHPLAKYFTIIFYQNSLWFQVVQYGFLYNDYLVQRFSSRDFEIFLALYICLFVNSFIYIYIFVGFFSTHFFPSYNASNRFFMLRFEEFSSSLLETIFLNFFILHCFLVVFSFVFSRQLDSFTTTQP